MAPGIKHLISANKWLLLCLSVFLHSFSNEDRNYQTKIISRFFDGKDEIKDIHSERSFCAKKWMGDVSLNYDRLDV